MDLEPAAEVVGGHEQLQKLQVCPKPVRLVLVVVLDRGVLGGVIRHVGLTVIRQDDLGALTSCRSSDRCYRELIWDAGHRER